VDAGEQSAVIAFLADPANWENGVTRVERIDTHGAVVFLGGERALKLKRAVKFDYMDFSTVERRRACCEAEVRLNRRTAPKLYRGVVAVTRRPGGRLAIGGEGEAVDWLVDMRRFRQADVFDQLAAAGKLTPGLIEGAVDAIAALHRGAETRPDAGGAESFRRVIENNTRQFQAQGGVFDPAAAAGLRADSLARLEQSAALIEARRAGGFVRQCHGDLHLRNIVLSEDQPTLFDCIEFNDAFAAIDVFYDLAFLLMDLLYRGLGGLANTALNRYVAAGDDLDALALLPLYLSSRAAVRAHVAASMAAVQPDAAKAGDLRAEAGRYFALAGDFLRPPPVRLVAIGGWSGSGKSTLAYAIAPAIGAPPGAVVIRSDLVRKQMHGVAAAVRLPPAAYAAAVTERVYAEMRQRARRVLAAGHGAILDAVHGAQRERDDAERLAREAQAAFTGLWLEAPGQTMAERITGRIGDASDATVAVLQRQLDADSGPISWHRLVAGGPLESVAAAAIRLLPPRQS
jgi:uncharacterized protein